MCWKIELNVLKSWHTNNAFCKIFFYMCYWEPWILSPLHSKMVQIVNVCQWESWGCHFKCYLNATPGNCTSWQLHIHGRFEVPISMSVYRNSTLNSSSSLPCPPLKLVTFSTSSPDTKMCAISKLVSHISSMACSAELSSTITLMWLTYGAVQTELYNYVKPKQQTQWHYKPWSAYEINTINL